MSLTSMLFPTLIYEKKLLGVKSLESFWDILGRLRFKKSKNQIIRDHSCKEICKNNNRNPPEKLFRQCHNIRKSDYYVTDKRYDSDVAGLLYC